MIFEWDRMRKIQFDGASKGNPGRMGIGVVLIDRGAIVDTISEKLDGEGTNNTAEYTALLRGIKKAKEHGWRSFVIEGDSEVVIRQVRGEYQVRKKHLAPLHQQVMRELGDLDSYEAHWIPRERNTRADKLSNDAVKSPPQKKKAVVGITCPKCSAKCTFKWQVFKNGTRHIRQECPKHGWVQYAKQVEPFISLVKGD